MGTVAQPSIGVLPRLEGTKVQPRTAATAASSSDLRPLLVFT